MSELKHKMTTRSSRQSAADPKPPSVERQQPKQPSKSKEKAPAVKRTLQQQSLKSMLFKQEEKTVIIQPLEVLYRIKELLKTTSIDDILAQCPKIKQLYELLLAQPSIAQKIIYCCLDKYFHGNTTSLWGNKYGPRAVSELFQPHFAQKIQEWIKDFYYFKKEDCPVDSDLQFIDDQPSYSYQQSMQNRMKQHGWNCKGLLLKGRSGVGKTSLLNAIAKSMRIRCFQYASDVDQLQKMKQLLEESNKSQCLDTFQPKKKEQLLIRSNPSIMQFIPPQREALITKQPKRMQIFRNFTLYFAPYEKSDKQGAEDSYFRYLFESIQKATIPYVLTTSKRSINFRQKTMNEKLLKLDEIQFVENTTQDLTYFYWVIFQIQTNLRLNSSKKIKKSQLYHELNLQFENLSFIIHDVLNYIGQLIIAANKRPIYIAKYLQFYISNFQNQGNYQKAFEDSLHKVAAEIIAKIDSQSLINNIDWALFPQNNEQLNPLEQTAAQQSDKSVKEEPKQVFKEEKRPSLKQMRQILELEALGDRFSFRKEQTCVQDLNEIKFQDLRSIPMEFHIKAKQKIIENIKSRALGSTDSKEKKRKYLCLKESELFYVPLMFPSKRTSNRTLRRQNSESIFQNLGKVLNQRQLAYVQKFAKFVSIT